MSRGRIAAQVAGGRWRREGLAVVMHNGPLSSDQRHRVALVHAGPHAVLTSFTAASLLGLRGWERDDTFVLAPSGTRLRGACPVGIRLHLCSRPPRREPGKPMELFVDSVLRAAATFPTERPACAIIAAAVQQKLCTADDVCAALNRSTRIRHRRAMLLATADIAGGADALSEIDFVRLCRRHGLPEPVLQRLRLDSVGRRRYLDASWRRSDGKVVAVEIDGALHLAVSRWWDDQDRQNELSISDAMVLRFPSVAVRSNEARVVDQLRRALLL